MSDPTAKSGPLTQDDIQAIWEGAVDKGYSLPLLDAGEGNGFEAWSQLFAQLTRAALAIDISTQAMFIQPWSGQSNPPASGARFATVNLTFSRTSYLDRVLLFAAGSTFVGEEVTDWGRDEGVIVQTGRRYALAQNLLFVPGESGPFAVPAIAERSGYGYNNPFPGTIKRLTQVGTGFLHDNATVTVTAGSMPPPSNTTVILRALDEPDMFIPDHIGQYVLLSAGANAGRMARMVAFYPPDLTGFPPKGTAVALEPMAVIEAITFAGSFLSGEQVQVKNGGTIVGYGTFIAMHVNGAHHRIAYVQTAGTLTQGNTLLGTQSAATATADIVMLNPLFVAEAGTASWRVIDWAAEFGVTVSNDFSPAGGVAGMLDELGNERDLPRAPGEFDDSYRKRVTQIADVVVPNAIRRTLNRVIPGIPWCFREAGLALLPGFFYDRFHDVAGDFYDNDSLLWTGALASGTFIINEKIRYLRLGGLLLQAEGYYGGVVTGNLVMIRRHTGPAPTFAAGDIVVGLQSGAIWNVAANTPNPYNDAHKWHIYFGYLEFRAYFLIGLPSLGSGEFGFAYDTHPRGAFDAQPFNDFYDGSPADASKLYRNVYAAIDKIRAGGVSFDLYIENGPCA